jgi:capsular exopolysaccharide synthesis family protein
MINEFANAPLGARYESPFGPLRSTRDGIDAHLVSVVDDASLAAEQYRVLGHTVTQLHSARGVQVLAVTSSAVGDGKTTTAINLAGALAQSTEGRILLVDADLRGPSVTKRLGQRDGLHPGLVDAVLDGNLSLTDVVRDVGPLRVSIVHAGLKTAVPYEVLRSPRVGNLLEQARRQYEYVIVDTPPFVPAPDCRVIAKWVDGFLLVVAAHKTSRKMFEAVLDVIDPAQLIGVVFNGSDDRPLSKYYGRYASVGAARNADGPRWWRRLIAPNGNRRRLGRTASRHDHD